MISVLVIKGHAAKGDNLLEQYHIGNRDKNITH